MSTTVNCGGARTVVGAASSTIGPTELGASPWGFRLIVALAVVLADVATAAIGFGVVVAAVALTGFVVVMQKNLRLHAKLRSTVFELQASRAGTVAAVDAEHQRFERDLHDDVQQRLVALGIKLELAADRVGGQSQASGDAIRELGSDIDEMLEELRCLARGANPTILVTSGLGPVLRALGRGAVTPTTVKAARLARHSPEIERAVYFSCSEALQNAVKHARGARSVTISVWQEEDLHFEVRDDGIGFDPATAPRGIGLNSLGVRLAAVGGELRILSAPGQGTTVAGAIPIRRMRKRTIDRRIGRTDLSLAKDGNL
jgi:signal transduction histidine kinase